MLLPILELNINKKKIKIKRKIQNTKNQKITYEKTCIYQFSRTYKNSQEIAKDWLRKVKIYKIRKFDPVDKENSIFKEENLTLYVEGLNWNFSMFN